MRWESAQRISPKDAAVVTGTKGEEAPEAGAKKPLSDRPLCVWITDGGTSEDDTKLEALTFKAEKVALGLKAFRTVRMDGAQAAADPLLAEQGKETPRLLLIDPTDAKVTVLEKGKLSAGAVYSALEAAAARYYVQKLDKTVKTHLDLLCDQDQLANKVKKLEGDVARLGEKDGAAAKKDLDEAKAELEAVRKQQADLAKKQVELWKLTPKGERKAEA